MASVLKRCIVLVAATSVTFVAGCAHMEKAPPERKTGYAYLHQPLPEASRKASEARLAGKDKQCPDEFKSANDTINKAYEIYIACRTEEGIAMAQDGINQMNALCPAKKVEVVPPPPAPAPKPVPPPPPAAPKASLSISPASIVKGQSATLNWSSQNASECTIDQAVGKVSTQGSMSVSPTDNTRYALTCSGEGGNADSNASIVVTAPVAVAKAALIAKMCQPNVINIQFDFDKSDIKPEFHDELKNLADFLIEFPKASGAIEGYTDNIGSKKYNMALSQRRADKVRSYLIKNFAIAPERLKAKGFGLENPIADNKTDAGRAKNRRMQSNLKCN